jgi:hypothetical protein
MCFMCFVIPSGDNFPDVTLAESMIEAIKDLRRHNLQEEL